MKRPEAGEGHSPDRPGLLFSPTSVALSWVGRGPAFPQVAAQRGRGAGAWALGSLRGAGPGGGFGFLSPCLCSFFSAFFLLVLVLFELR